MYQFQGKVLVTLREILRRRISENEVEVMPGLAGRLNRRKLSVLQDFLDGARDYLPHQAIMALDAMNVVPRELIVMFATAEPFSELIPIDSIMAVLEERYGKPGGNSYVKTEQIEQKVDSVGDQASWSFDGPSEAPGNDGA